MSKFLVKLVVLLSAILAYAPISHSHCQVPCGIFDDRAEVEAMLLDVVTARKSVKEIIALSGKTDPQSLNQLVRWINNKDDHADKIISTISEYFLAQRVKTSQEDYTERLKKHHAVMVAAMKVKQNTDSKHLDILEDSVRALLPYYAEHSHDEKK